MWVGKQHPYRTNSRYKVITAGDTTMGRKPLLGVVSIKGRGHHFFGKNVPKELANLDLWTRVYITKTDFVVARDLRNSLGRALAARSC